MLSIGRRGDYLEEGGRTDRVYITDKLQNNEMIPNDIAKHR
jgi:hypothetical protein